MAEKLVDLSHVTKKYRDCVAVNDCSLSLTEGRIYGLVGKNGAGKTTLIRMIAGLSIPDSGKITLSDKTAGRIGTLIEAPNLNGSMTAVENFKFYRMLSGKKEGGRTDQELLDMVGLTDIKRRKVKDYSLGMRQRLGIAVALLSGASFIMLDEPVNGLDPVGVVEIRKLVKELCSASGMTFLISSHNLPELYQTATDYLIIDRGSLKKEISHDELEREHQESLEEYFLSVIAQ